MNVDVGTIVGLLGTLIGLGSLYATWITSRASAKKDDVEALRGIIAELRHRMKEAEQEIQTWQRRFARVCDKMEVDPDDFITGPLAGLGSGWDGDEGNGE